MGVRRKKRGYDTTGGARQSTREIEERKREWNVDFTKRTLSAMFSEIAIDESQSVISNATRRVSYNPITLYEKAQEYFNNIIEVNKEGLYVIPDVEDFCMFANISRQRFFSYKTSEDAKMAEVANAIGTAIANCKKQSALQGNINPTVFAIDFNNNHDYVQAKSEITMNSNVSLTQIESNIEDIVNRLPMEERLMLDDFGTGAKDISKDTRTGEED